MDDVLIKYHEYLIYLVEIARAGGLVEDIPLSTGALGEVLNVSQQTASRHMKILHDAGLINRKRDGTRVQRVSLTPRGFELLKELHDELESILAGEGQTFLLKGRVTSGIGEGRYYVSKYADYFERNLGIKPFPGTLNIVLLEDKDINMRRSIEMRGGILLQGFTDETRSFGDVWAFRIELRKHTRGSSDEKCTGYFLKIKRTHYKDDVMEILSEKNLRETLNLKDDDIVSIHYDPAKNGC